MKKLSTLLFGVTIAVVALFAFGVRDAQAVCSWAGVPNEAALVVVNNTSLDAGHNNLTIGVNGNLSGDRHSTTPECFQTEGGPAPYCSWADVPSQTSPANTVSITSGPSGVGGQAITVTVTPGTSGTGCFDPGTETRFNGSRVLNVSALPNGSYNFTVQVTDTFGGSDTANGSFTIARAVTHTLSVSKAGSGTGTVTSSPAGINCGSDCSEAYAAGTSVTLSQSAAAGSTFAGWSGACSGTGSCVVSMTQARSVTATFNTSGAPTCSPSPATVTTGQTTSISASGGSGGASPYYTWNTGGGTSCSAGTPCVTSWTTTGSKTITVTRNGVPGTCQVTVNPPGAYTLTVMKVPSATGDGTDYADITSSPAGISCLGTCNSDSYSFPAGQVINSVTNVTPPGTYEGLDPGSSPGCSNPLTLNSNMTCILRFGLSTPGDDDDDPPGSLTCSGPANVAQNTNATFNASGGTGAYSWSASGANPSSGSGAGFTTRWATIGTKVVYVNSGGQSACTVCVGGFGSCEPEGDPPTAQVRINGLLTPQTVNYLQSATVSWSSVNATSCTLTSIPSDPNWDQASTGTAGSKTVARANSTEYRARCVNARGIANAANTLKIRPECLPAGQPALVGETVNLTARGGNGTYAWTASGGAPSDTGSGTSFDVSYATAGTKTITVNSDSITSYGCTVTVSDTPPSTGTIVVQSNIATTWSVTGPSGTQTQGLPGAISATYENQAVGSYTISNVPDIDGYTKAITPGDSQWLSADETKTFTITYTSEEEPPGGGDPGVSIVANGESDSILVLEGSRALLAWSATSVVSGSCVGTTEPVATSWDGSGKSDPTGSEWSPNITETYTFVITCEADDGAKEGSGALVSDSVEVGPRPPQCSDRQFWIDRGEAGEADNDGDTKIDEEDPGCWTGGAVGAGSYNPDDDREDNEGDDGPPSDIVTDCNDGLDNDGDGFVDHESVTPTGKEADPGCESPLDPSELDDPDIREI